jgi:argininosuccinate lyase
MCDCFCSDSNEMPKTESEKKQVEEALQEIKQEGALRQYREKTDDVFSGWESVLCSKGVAWFR